MNFKILSKIIICGRLKKYNPPRFLLRERGVSHPLKNTVRIEIFHLLYAAHGVYEFQPRRDEAVL